MVGKEKANGVSLPSSRRKRYHKRSPWACDECRLRKKKCDGGQPCGPCKSTINACTYEIRRPAQPPTQRIRSLEDHLRFATSFLKELEKKLPSINGVDIGAALKVLDFTSPAEGSPPPSRQEPRNFKLASMLTGCDQVVREGPWSMSFYGGTSGFSFVMRTLELFQKPESQLEPECRSVVTRLYDTPLPSREVPRQETHDLPAPRFVSLLISAVFARCHPLLQFLEQKDFEDMVNHIYDDFSSHGNSDERSIALLHLVLALGYLFQVEYHQESGCKTALKEATNHFLTGFDSLEPSNPPDLLSLQTILCAILFLLSTSRLTRAHSLLGTACSSALRLGLHTSTANSGLSADHIRSRTKVFAAVVKLDIYLGLILGLPPFIRMDDIDQNMIASMANPSLETSSLRSKASAMHFDLARLTILSADSMQQAQRDSVDIHRLAEVERQLHAWSRHVSPLFIKETNREEANLIKHELKMAYHFAQMLLFQPFLHYLRIMADGGTITLNESQHALACIKVASTTITNAESMLSRGVMPPASWTSVYTVFLSVMCLIFLIAAHNGTSQPSEAWRKAAAGIKVLAAHRCVDDGATACLDILRLVVSQLSHTVDFDFDQIESSTPRLCSKHRPSVESTEVIEAVTPPQAKLSLAHILINESQLGEASQVSTPTWQSDADKMLAQAEEMSLLYGFEMSEDYDY